MPRPTAMSKRIPEVAWVLAAAVVSCSSAEPFEGLAPAQHSGGPRVVFDLSRAPFPEIPFPNDILTRVDSSSRTGLRLNASLVAPSQFERDLHGRLDGLDGFGTFAPLTVAFDADLDVLDLLARQTDTDATNDAVYLVELATGKTWPLDFGVGPHSRFPYALVGDPTVPYFVGDPFAGTSNLLFPTTGPAANLLHPLDPAFGASHGAVAQQDEDLLEFYERSTHTLILRPILPLRQETRYAVLLTNRLRDSQARAVVAPGSGINHPAQSGELKPLLSHLPAGVALSDIAYAWAFTTQSSTREMEAIALGLNGTGGLAILGNQFVVQLAAPEIGQGAYRTVMQLLPEQDNAAATDLAAYRISATDLLAFLREPGVAAAVGGIDPAQLDALAGSFQYVDYFVSGNFTSPNFLGNSDRAPQDATFQLDLTGGQSQVLNAQVPFLIAVPKASSTHSPPFPTVIVGHGDGGSRFDMLAFAGTFAKFGLASASIDAFGHGLAPDAGTAATLRAAAQKHSIRAFANVLLTGRARDLDNNGIGDPGGDLWTGQMFHTRDVVRQSVADWVQLAKLIHTFDGTGQFLLAIDATGNEVFTVAGDFNGDGVPDLGGLPIFPGNVTRPPPDSSVVFPIGAANPGSDVFVFGESLGGILTGILPAVEPSIRAAASVSGGGGLTDIALRSSLQTITEGVFLEMLGPFVATCPYSAGLGRCAPGEPDAQPTLVMVVADLNRELDLPIAPLTLQAGDKLSVRNLAQLPDARPCTGDPLSGCATGTADASGNVRVAFTADWPILSVAPTTPTGAPGAVTVVAPGDPLRIEISGSKTLTVDTFGFNATLYGVTYRKGDPLTAPARGYGRTRNTPELRRMMQLSQIALDPADPVNYAPHYFQDQLTARQGQGPVPTLVVGTVGDPAVPTSTAVALARAAGLVEMTRPDPSYGIPIDQVLIESGVVEGVARTQRFASAAFGPRATLPDHVRCDGAAACTGPVLVDPSGYSCDATGGGCTDGIPAPRLSPPLQAQLLRPVTLLDGTTAFSGLMLPYLSRTGQHGFQAPQPQKPFDIDQYMANVIGRYFETRGREVRFDPCQAALLAGCSWMAPPPP